MQKIKFIVNLQWPLSLELKLSSEKIELLEECHKRVLAKVQLSARNFGAGYLHATRDGRYTLNPPHYWTSGFWPGLLRLALNEIEDEFLKDFAERAETGLFEMFGNSDFLGLHHDIGFQFMPTAVMRFRQTGAEDAKLRGIIAANLLAGRFNPASGVIEAWNGDERRGYSIIDSIMNLPLLFWASEVMREPRYANMAISHLDRVMKDFIQEDGTTHHIVEYDQHSGIVVTEHGGQGYAPNSAWSRGLAWAIYGFAIAARYTKREDYLAKSRGFADRFLELNAPHGVPPWDFRTPDPHAAARDSSSAAIAACGLLELDALGHGDARNQAASLLSILIEKVACFDDDQDGLLLHGTSAHPAGIHVGDSLIYGDYYFFEALQRFAGSGRTCW